MRAHLIDASKYQVSFDSDKITGTLDGIIIRASYGLMPDQKFLELTEAAKSIKARGSYHYFSSAVPWETQAKFFLDQVNDKDFHFFALDFERAYNSKSAAFALGAQKWLSYVVDKTGKKALLYTNPSTYNDWLLPFGNWMIEFPLWIAQYPYNAWNAYVESIRTNITINPKLPRKRSDWTLWQYSADGNNKGAEYGVGSRDIDLNVFDGTVAEFYTFVGVEVPVEPIPEPPQPPVPPVLPKPPSSNKGCLPAVVDIVKSAIQSRRS